MPKCIYCKKQYDFPKGTTIVTNKGNINYLCSSKCRKNMAMKRRKVRWISKEKKSLSNSSQENIIKHENRKI